ncbi:hypothetical protein MAR_005248 [Mya arenaria]|uniref:Uncharacterized protein n=1 Tax=Mya arenaria TaxID=6604 RepID=A0ABY7F351_MYAAR|nr:hypothetical protein MAR_005248 [Mya arenaria]
MLKQELQRDDCTNISTANAIRLVRILLTASYKPAHYVLFDITATAKTNNGTNHRGFSEYILEILRNSTRRILVDIILLVK